MFTALLLTIAAQVSEPTPKAFFDEALVWDSTLKAPVLGREKKPVGRLEFYERVGRPDLVTASKSAMYRRVGFGIASGVMAVTGIVGGVLMLAKSPNMNSAFCVDNVDNYNFCNTKNRFQQIGGIVFVATGLGSAMLLATIAYWQAPDVVDHDESIHLVSQYNATLLKKLRDVPRTLRWMPALSPDGGMLAVSGRF